VHRRDHPAGFRWVHESFGTNWRMTEMQAAIGRVQLGKLDGWVARRRRNAGLLAGRLGTVPGVGIESPGPDFFHAYYKLYVTLEPGALARGWSRDRVVAEINAAGLPCLAGVCPEMYREQAFVRAGYVPEKPFPVARDLGSRSLLLLVHPTLTDEDLHRYAGAVERVLHSALRNPGAIDP